MIVNTILVSEIKGSLLGKQINLANPMENLFARWN